MISFILLTLSSLPCQNQFEPFNLNSSSFFHFCSFNLNKMVSFFYFLCFVFSLPFLFPRPPSLSLSLFLSLFVIVDSLHYIVTNVHPSGMHIIPRVLCFFVFALFYLHFLFFFLFFIFLFFLPHYLFTLGTFLSLSLSLSLSL